MRKVLVTGGLGYIGSHTILQLFRSGQFEPIAVDSCTRCDRHVKEQIETTVGQKLKFYEIDVCDKDKLFDIFETEGEIDSVIHFAAYKSVPESYEFPIMYHSNNVGSLENVIAACKKYYVRNLVFSSSCAVYGEVHTLPVDERMPFGDNLSPYAQTKVTGERLLRLAFKDSFTKCVALRYFNPAGADESGLVGESPVDKPTNLIPVLMEVAKGERPYVEVFGTDYETKDGTCIRDYVHVSDIADAHVEAIRYLNREYEAPCFDVVNLGSGNGFSVFEIVKAFQRVTGQALNIRLAERRVGDIPAIFSDSTKAENLLGWKCRRGIEDILSSAWHWSQKGTSQAKTRLIQPQSSSI